MLIVLPSAVLRCSAFRSRSSYKRRTSTAVVVVVVVSNSTHSSTKHKDKLVNSWNKCNDSGKKCHISFTTSKEVHPEIHQSIHDRSRLESLKTTRSCLLYNDQTVKKPRVTQIKAFTNKLFPLSSDITLFNNNPSAN